MDFIEKLEDGISGVFFIGDGENIDNYTKTYGITRKNDINLMEIMSIIPHEKEQEPNDFGVINTVYGRTENGEVLIPQINHIGINTSSPESYAKIISREFLYGKDASSFLNGKAERIEINFDDVSSWTGTLSQSIQPSDDKTELTIKLSSKNFGNENLLDGKFNLEIESTFNGTSSHSNISFDMPLKFVISSLEGPLHINNYIPLITRIQDLLNFSQHAFIPVESIQVFNGSQKSYFWSESFMKIPLGAKEYNSKNLPFFTLGSIGGVQGVIKWLEGYESLSKVIGPISTRWATHAMAFETRILNVGSATESLFAAEARRRRATKDKTKNDFNQLYVTKRAGESFKNWLSESEDYTRKFAELLKIHFNLIKHNDSFDQDISDTYAIAESAEIMLENIIFNVIYPDLDLDYAIYDWRKTYYAQERIREVLKKDIKRSSYL